MQHMTDKQTTTRKRLTVSGLAAIVAIAAGGLASFQGGRRAQLAATSPPPVLVYITPRGKHYHTAACRYAARGTPVALDQVNARYARCAYCSPPPAPVPASR